MTATTETPQRVSLRVRVQQLGTALSNMVMPNIGAFIAWGLITALFIKTGWLPSLFHSLQNPDGWVAHIGGWGAFEKGGIVGPMITYLLPILIGSTGGRMVYGTRGAVVGAITTMGVVAGSDVPMFMGAMIMGPLGGWVIKKLDALWDGKIRPGFEMLVNNFSAGIAGLVMAVIGFFGVGPVVSAFTRGAGHGVDFLVGHDLLPLTSIFIEPAKVLFLNNAINHGVLTPLGTTQALATGKSVLFLLEANPGPGLGILLAFMVFGRGAAKASAPGAAIIQFLGGIHEIYFPYVLMKPKLIAATILGGMTGVFINVLFGSGLRAPAAPGSIIAVYAQTATGSYLGVTLSVLGAAAVSFAVAAVLLKTDRATDEPDLAAATAEMEALKGKRSSVAAVLTGGSTAPISNIVFACDAGMGSSAMGASVLRKKIRDAGITGVTVVNQAISNLTDTYGLTVTHRDLTERARQKTPSALHVSVDDFMNSPRYDEIVELLGRTNGAAPRTNPLRPQPNPPLPTMCCHSTRSCWPARPPPPRPPSPRRATCWSPHRPSTPRMSTPCTSARNQFRRTWATAWRSRTAPTTPRARSAIPASRSSAIPNPSIGTASPPSSWWASPAPARTTWRFSPALPTCSWTRTRSSGYAGPAPPRRFGRC